MKQCQGNGAGKEPRDYQGIVGKSILHGVEKEHIP